MTNPVDTRNIAEWRRLRFDNIDECIREVERIVDAHDKDELRAAGNWTPGQVMSHIASWIEYAYDGFPIGPPPIVVRWIFRWRLLKMLRDGLPRGRRIPGVKEGTFGMEEMKTTEAASQLIHALRRLASDEPGKYGHPAFGTLSHHDRIRLNLRHAELHLGFLSY